MKFYEQYDTIPLFEDVRPNGRFKKMSRFTPSDRVLYKVLGPQRSGWLESCKLILGYEIHKKMSKCESEDLESRNPRVEFEDFFKIIANVKAAVEEGAIAKVQQMATYFAYETKVFTEIDGMTLRFSAEIKK